MDTINQEPRKTHLTRGDIMEWTGCSEWEYRQWVEVGLLVPLEGFGKRKRFLKSQVRRALGLDGEGAA